MGVHRDMTYPTHPMIFFNPSPPMHPPWGTPHLKIDDIKTNVLHVLTYYGFSKSLCYDNATH